MARLRSDDDRSDWTGSLQDEREIDRQLLTFHALVGEVTAVRACPLCRGWQVDCLGSGLTRAEALVREERAVEEHLEACAGGLDRVLRMRARMAGARAGEEQRRAGL